MFFSSSGTRLCPVTVTTLSNRIDEGFWCLSCAYERGAILVSPCTDVDGTAVWCGLEPLANLCFRRKSGARFTDVIGNADLYPIIVSERFIDVLRSGPFTGWRSSPCTIIDRDDSDIEGYFVLSIVGRCGSIVPELSQRVPALKSNGEPIPDKYDYEGIFFEPGTWDGSDIFLPTRGPTTPWTSRRLKDALILAKVTNVEFESTLDKRTPVGYLIR